MEVDRPKLVNQDQAVLRLAGMATRDGHLPGVPRRPRRDRADRCASGPVERLIRHDKRSAAAPLLVSDGRIEINDDDRPAERGGCHAGQRSGSSNAAAISAASMVNSGSSAASAQRLASASSRTAGRAPRPRDRPPRPATSRSGRRARGRDLPSRVEGCTCASSWLPCTHDRRVRMTCQALGRASTRGYMYARCPPTICISFVHAQAHHDRSGHGPRQGGGSRPGHDEGDRNRSCRPRRGRPATAALPCRLRAGDRSRRLTDAVPLAGRGGGRILVLRGHRSEFKSPAASSTGRGDRFVLAKRRTSGWMPGAQIALAWRAGRTVKASAEEDLLAVAWGALELEHPALRLAGRPVPRTR